eukprot:TRINITY_DN23510_c0_g2_i2.p2 TRINITY_DN23510_c0_g2~~TRINITY_DN23510_c0_g2_i2.p2  ORF type:complete len:149 (+),score=18.68 TRINITY_DN23510_c0_g2_i2:182-628(+)
MSSDLAGKADHLARHQTLQSRSIREQEAGLAQESVSSSAALTYPKELLEKGELIILQGPTSSALNGQLGRVVPAISDAGRHRVIWEHSKTIKLVKPCDLRSVEETCLKLDGVETPLPAEELEHVSLEEKGARSTPTSQSSTDHRWWHP